MIARRYKDYERELRNLKKAGINGGTWIDAGCGQGAYTIPLAMLVDVVIAIDQNSGHLNKLDKNLKNLEFLEELLNERRNKNQFTVVILEYERIIPVSWVPHPYPIEKIKELAQKNGKFNLKIIFQNERYYIGKLFINESNIR